MARIVGFAALSHAPFWDGSVSSATGPGAAFVRGVNQARRLARQARPDVVVVFGPDHYRNFFLDLMPPFCVGTGEVVGVGDYGTVEGSLPVRTGFGRQLVDHVREAGFDPATSVRMGVDHGIVQPYSVLFGTDVPICPIMVNCGADPRPSFARCFEFGRAVGEAITTATAAERVFVVGSGGLSHRVKPLSLEDDAVDDDTREYLIDGRARVREYNAAREASLARRIAQGVNGVVNSDWDTEFLRRLTHEDYAALTEMKSADVERVAGNGAHEVRPWLAAAGAWGGAIELLAYEPVPSWVTGMAVVGAAL